MEAPVTIGDGIAVGVMAFAMFGMVAVLIRGWPGGGG